ncbi:MAG: hypothetical protein ACKOBM_10925 [Gammaproteobacteria bacterium]
MIDRKQRAMRLRGMYWYEPSDAPITALKEHFSLGSLESVVPNRHKRVVVHGAPAPERAKIRIKH